MALQLTVVALAAWRITRLVTTDDICAPLRLAVGRRWAGRWPETLVTCRHCLGVWACALSWACWQVGATQPLVILAAASIISMWEERWR
ncbi:MAG: hypothetical protein KatS3mg014_2527 [Actinomycetota bacterium]|nr:MAG: hypothetical protein KatS3mg014_2478 [Actinomycetota bacterium]GIV00912.1 MAG: hypothetical protein KatS3mg014_2527 [Actinomycetota bacterium]